MKETYENITPKMAERYLNANTNNRPLRPGHAEKMIADMKDGAWTTCLAPIAFYQDGSLADGQHRLWAIVEAGLPFKFKVVRGLSKADGVNIDTGIPRTAVDVAKIQGIDTEISTSIAAIARGIEDGYPGQGRKLRSISQQLVVIAKHRSVAHWVSKHGPSGRGMRNAAVMAAIGRAYYIEVEHERLAAFSQVLSKGFVESNDDTAAIALRNYIILRLQQNVSPGGSKMWRDTFLKTQNAIYNFMRRRPLTMIKSITDESYPLIDIAAVKEPVSQQGKARAARAKKALKKRK